MKSMKIKAIVSVLLAVFFILTCVGCGSSSEPGGGQDTKKADPTPAAPKESASRAETFSPDEYVLYQNIFYNGYGESFVDKPVNKEGVFAIIHDAYNDRVRYYVWGYYDQTKCCDWQWEFVPAEGAELPTPGSLITVSGTFAFDVRALDKYWIKDAEFTVKTAYTGPTAEIDMLSMSCTLERVQMYNFIGRSDAFPDNEFTAYGRIASVGALEDPYYDNSWKIDVKWDGTYPAIGTLVELKGTVSGGKLNVTDMKNAE